MIRIILIAGLMLFQAPNEDDPEYRHPDAPANSPPCHNYHDSAKQNCRCPKAMRPEGRESERPDKAKGEGWCDDFCLTGKCLCVSPRKMPIGRK